MAVEHERKGWPRFSSGGAGGLSAPHVLASNSGISFHVRAPIVSFEE